MSDLDTKMLIYLKLVDITFPDYGNESKKKENRNYRNIALQYIFNQPESEREGTLRVKGPAFTEKIERVKTKMKKSLNILRKNTQELMCSEESSTD